MVRNLGCIKAKKAERITKRKKSGTVSTRDQKKSKSNTNSAATVPVIPNTQPCHPQVIFLFNFCPHPGHGNHFPDGVSNQCMFWEHAGHLRGTTVPIARGDVCRAL